jgi:hypothetical protein
MRNDYYVYVYIDPRNYEEFYYGKGRGSRKDFHLNDEADNEKSERIRSIEKDGLVPIVRVIAANLTEHEACIIETTLIWKLGKFITNIMAGKFSGKFRDHDTYHLELSGFDFQNGVYYYNVGEGDHRNWDDYIKYGFISAGQGVRWRDSILGFQKGDVFIAYLKGHGYVGVGRIIERAKPIRELIIDNYLLLDLDLKCPNMGDNSDDPDKSEYVGLVEWIKVVSRESAKWRPKSGLYTTPLVRASLDRQKKTIEFVQREFDVNIYKLII